MENVGVKDNYMLIQRLKSAGCFIVCVRSRCSSCRAVTW